MILYLQKCYEDSFMITKRFSYQSIMYPDDCNYEILEFDINGHTPIIEIYNLAVEKFGCKKLILDFSN